MNTPFRFDVEELKERLQVLKVNMPDDEILNNFVAIEKSLKAEVADLLETIGVAGPKGELRVYPGQVPRTKARMLIRSMFATIEGIVYGMKQLAFAANRTGGPLTFDELLICKEITLGLKGNGEVDGSSMRLKFEPNLKFAFAVLAKAFQQRFELDTNCLGWNRLVQSVEVRNRLTHPKRPSDLELTDDELGHAIEAYQWFDGQVGALLEMFCKNTEKVRDYLNTMLQHLQSCLAKKPGGDQGQEQRLSAEPGAERGASPDGGGM